MSAGIPVTEAEALPFVDNLFGISGQTAGRVSYLVLASLLAGSGSIANELSSIRSQVTRGLLAPSTWAELEALTGSEDAAGAEVPLSDEGTHSQATETGYDGDTVSNHGRYKWSAAWSRWVRIGEFGGAVSDVVVSLSGTANALSGSSDREHSKAPYAAKFVARVVDINTGPVTIGIDGGTARALVTNTGAELQAGELLPGMVIEWRWNGEEYRLIPGITVAAMTQRAEDARDAAESSRTLAAADRVATETARGLAEIARDGAAAAASLANTANTQAQLAAIAAGAKIFFTEAEGRAAVGDNEAHLEHVGNGTKIWRRDSSVSSTFMGWLFQVTYNTIADMEASADHFEDDTLIRVLSSPELAWVAVGSGERADLTNADGQNFQVIVGASRKFYGEAFGIKPGVDVDNTAAFDRMYNAAVAAYTQANAGGAPRLIFPMGVIETSGEYTLLNSMIIEGQGMSIGSDGTPNANAKGTWLILKSYGSLFTSGQPIGGDIRGTVNAQIRNMCITRHLSYRNVNHEDYDGTRGLIHGHGFSKLILENVYLGAGPTAGAHCSEAWDFDWFNVSVHHSGQPDGIAAVHFANSPNTSQDGNSNRFWHLRVEDSSGPAIYTEGNHFVLIAPKVHAPANSMGSVPMPAIRLGKNSTISAAQLSNFMPGSSGSTSCVVEIAGEGASVQDSIFRAIDGVVPFIITGNNSFSGGGTLMGNRIDGPGAGPCTVWDKRSASANGRAMTLGPEEAAGYSGAPGNNTAANAFGAFHAGGKPPTYQVTYEDVVYDFAYPHTAFFGKGSGIGAALHAHYTQGNESDKYAVAGYFQSWNLAQPVLVAEGTRTSGNVVELFRLISGLAHTAGKKAMRLLAQVGGVQTERFALWIDGSLIIGGYSAAEIGDSTHPINTTAKVPAKTIRDTTNGNRWIQASGSGATDPWMLLDGVSVAITPAPPP